MGQGVCIFDPEDALAHLKPPLRLIRRFSQGSGYSIGGTNFRYDPVIHPLWLGTSGGAIQRRLSPTLHPVRDGIMTRKYFEEFRVGEQRTAGEYLVTEEEIIEFASKWDPEPFHVDRDAAQASVFAGLTACGSHIIAIRTWLIHRLPNKAHVLAGLGIDELRFAAPVRPGDRLSLTIECVEARPSSSKPDRGIVRSLLTVANQKGETVLTSNEAVLVARRGAV